MASKGAHHSGTVADIHSHPLSAKRDQQKAKVMIFLESTKFQVIVTLLTVYALFGDDFRLAATPKSADDSFYGLSCVALAVFCVEFGLACFAKQGYLWGFYFWLDFLSTISLIPDIGWIWEPLTGTGDSGGGSTAALKAGRASRAGTKAGRIVRLARLVRMVRIVKLYKMRQEREKKKDGEAEIQMTLDEQINAEPSKVGKRLTELTTQRVIVLVLIMIVMSPVFDGEVSPTYVEFDTYQTYAFHRLHRLPQDFNTSITIEYPDNTDRLAELLEAPSMQGQTVNSVVSEQLFRHNVESYARSANGKILYMEVCATGCATVWPPETIRNWLVDLRFQRYDSAGALLNTEPFEQKKNTLADWTPADDLISKDLVESRYRTAELVTVEEINCYTGDGRVDARRDGECHSMVYFSVKATNQFDSGISMLKTVFVMLVLTVAVLVFSRDAQALVIGPIERMMDLVKKLAENPLGSTKTGQMVDDEDKHAAEEGYETALLEKTLSTIGGLLQVGFGVAGKEIIGKNMNSGALNVMLPGKLITSVFGFGIIEDFTETCTCLEEEMCTYINTIANIVHTGTHMFHGAANKNIGVAFLLVWKICDGKLPYLRDPRDPPPPPGEAPITPDEKNAKRAGIFMLSAGAGTKQRPVSPQEMVDSALTSFLKVRVELHHANHNGVLSKFQQNANMVQKFGADFKVHMGFGMHIGWAIEGAIGSRYKIDASYLSPNVNMAARLEAATHQFGCPMLLSGFFVEELSPAARRYCRLIDRVTVKGSQVPMDLWTFDIVSYPDGCLQPQFNADGQVPVNFQNDPDYAKLQDGLDKTFFVIFKTGVELYLAGEWPAARGKLEEALVLKPGDGPTRSLLRNMGKLDFQKPADWRGFRELTEK